MIEMGWNVTPKYDQGKLNEEKTLLKKLDNWICAFLFTTLNKHDESLTYVFVLHFLEWRFVFVFVFLV